MSKKTQKLKVKNTSNTSTEAEVIVEKEKGNDDDDTVEDSVQTDANDAAAEGVGNDERDKMRKSSSLVGDEAEFTSDNGGSGGNNDDSNGENIIAGQGDREKSAENGPGEGTSGNSSGAFFFFPEDGNEKQGPPLNSHQRRVERRGGEGDGNDDPTFSLTGEASASFSEGGSSDEDRFQDNGETKTSPRHDFHRREGMSGGGGGRGYDNPTLSLSGEGGYGPPRRMRGSYGRPQAFSQPPNPWGRGYGDGYGNYWGYYNSQGDAYGRNGENNYEDYYSRQEEEDSEYSEEGRDEEHHNPRF
jgi:hypothetical protein